MDYVNIRGYAKLRVLGAAWIRNQLFYARRAKASQDVIFYDTARKVFSTIDDLPESSRKFIEKYAEEMKNVRF